MFTGIVTEVGTVASARRRKGLLEAEIEAPSAAGELRRGDSIAVNGVCLTAVNVSPRRFKVEAVAETQARTTLGRLGPRAEVNLELPARLGDRLGGHLVQGHVDCVVEALRVETDEGNRRLWWRAPEAALGLIVPQGSVALDGVSLTVVDVAATHFEVAIIPHTLQATTLGKVAPGARANLELDVIAKYVARLTFGQRRAG